MATSSKPSLLSAERAPAKHIWQRLAWAMSMTATERASNEKELSWLRFFQARRRASMIFGKRPKSSQLAALVLPPCSRWYSSSILSESGGRSSSLGSSKKAIAYPPERAQRDRVGGRYHEAPDETNAVAKKPSS